MIINDTHCLGEFALECIRLTDMIYKRSRSVTELFELVYACCVYATESILQKFNSIIDHYNNIILGYFETTDIVSY
jgi:hypothetical protein